MRLRFPPFVTTVKLAVAIVAVSIAVYINYYSVPKFDFAPIPGSSHPLALQDVESILRKHFKTIRRIRQIPPTIEQSFSNLTGAPFDMGDPGGPLAPNGSVSDLPHRRLIFFAFTDNAAILAYEQSTSRTIPVELVAVLYFVDPEGAWFAELKSDANNLEGLRNVIRRGEFDTANLQHR